MATVMGATTWHKKTARVLSSVHAACNMHTVHTVLVLEFYSLRLSYSVHSIDSDMHTVYACTCSGSPHNVMHSSSYMHMQEGG